MISLEEHDHDAPTHSMNCPIEGCDYVLKIHAHDDDEALHNMMEALGAHFEYAHEDNEVIADEIEQKIKENMTRQTV